MIRSKHILVGLVALCDCVSVAHAQSVDWVAYGRASAFTVAQAMPRGEGGECAAIEQTEITLSRVLASWRFGGTAGAFHEGLYQEYLNQLKLGRERCGLDGELPGRSVGRVASSIAAGLWEAELRGLVFETSQFIVERVFANPRIVLSDEEAAECEAAVADYFFAGVEDSLAAIDAGEFSIEASLSCLQMPSEIARTVCVRSE